MTAKIGNRIKNIRTSLNLKQKEFSKKLNIAASSLSEIETGRYSPGLDVIITLAKEFDVDLYYLLMGEGEMFISPDLLSITRLKEYAFNTEQVRDFLYYFQRSTTLQYSILSHFSGMMTEKKSTILKETKKYEEDKGASK